MTSQRQTRFSYITSSYINITYVTLYIFIITYISYTYTSTLHNYIQQKKKHRTSTSPYISSSLHTYLVHTQSTLHIYTFRGQRAAAQEMIGPFHHLQKLTQCHMIIAGKYTQPPSWLI